MKKHCGTILLVTAAVNLRIITQIFEICMKWCYLDYQSTEETES
jgi:hypothetical protein